VSKTTLIDSRIRKYAYREISQIYQDIGASPDGLSHEQVEAMREKYGANSFTERKNDTMIRRLRRAFINPFNIILFILGIISLVTDVFLVSNFARNATTAIIIFSMILISGAIRLIQELRAKNAAQQLNRLIHESITVRREGELIEISAEKLVVGDIVLLSAGDRVPADIRLTEVTDLFISQAAITGESAILEKSCRALSYSSLETLTQLENLAFMATTVISGKGEGIVLAVGKDTLYGSFAKPDSDDKKSFQKGANSIAWVMLRFIAVLIPIVFALLGVTGGKWLESFAFALSVAVGLMPEMLPMVITACLARGSLTMSRKQTIIKDINAMQGFGSMDVLCMDKTGTLTNESILLEYYMDVLGNESSEVLDLAFLNSSFHSGVRNPIDNAILACQTMPGSEAHYTDLLAQYQKVDEIPFDYARKFVSTLVIDKNGDSQLIMKGDISHIVNRCSHVEYRGEILPIEKSGMQSVSFVVDEMLQDGMKVIAVARKNVGQQNQIMEFHVPHVMPLPLLRFKEVRPMNKKENRMAVRQAVEKAVIRDEQNRRIQFAATNPIKEVLKNLHTTLRGLDAEAVSVSRTKYGSNKVTHEKKKSLVKQLAGAFINPFTAILFCLALVSTMTDMVFPYFSLLGSVPEDFDPLTMAIILTMVMISGTLRFVQESRSGNAAEKLLAMITSTCTVTRKDQVKVEIPMDDLVVGDIVHLSAGDMIPADVRILDAKDLFVSQASLTGESEPIEKTPNVSAAKDSITDYTNIAFMGSNVISGSATAVVICVGDNTLFGSMASAVAGEAVETSFTKGVNAVSWVLIRFMLVMVPLVFFINGITKGDWLEAFLFGISIAVGLTPEMLPMIVTTCLAKGAVSMSKKQTIVKNLNSIQNFGAIDILCTDKTGTLTQDKVVLEYHLNVNGEDDTRVLRHAYLNSYFQTGYKNLMDLAIIHKTEEEEAADSRLLDLSENYVKVDEIPFDFTRRRLTTVVQDKQGKTQMVTKGAVEEMLSVCTFAECDDGVEPLTDEVRSRILKTVDALNDKGFRVLAIAQKSNPSPVGAFGVKDECDMVLIGYLAFLDPPKESTADAIKALKNHGVTTKILTGDNDKVTRTICKQVGLKVRNMLLGSDLDNMSDAELARAAESTDVFAKLTPDQKARVVSVLRENGHTVGFMGDGINDAAAMKAADIGISVDTAVDVAKESADIILLEKDLMVLEQGIIEGRKTYANMIKYIKMTASSNFGNMFSVLAASALLPFLPMMSVHLIFLNLIYDLSCTAIPWDNVDEEFIAKPRKWDASSVGSFMIWIGPTSSIFDFTTYIFMYFVFCPMFVSGGVLFNDLAAHYSGAELVAMQAQYIGMFQAGWFVESMWSQTLVIHMIRTPKLPFIQSRASAPVM